MTTTIQDLRAILDDAEKHRNQPPMIKQLLGWSREQWAVAIAWYYRNPRPDFLIYNECEMRRHLGNGKLHDIQVEWQRNFRGDPFELGKMVFDCFEAENPQFMRFKS